MELKREDIVKALECCIEEKCENCCNLGRWHEQWNCMRDIMKYALSLIRELTEDNEIKSQKRANIFEIVDAFERGRTDGVRKMQSKIEARCIKGGIYPAFVRSTIEQIAREMIGGNNGNKED